MEIDKLGEPIGKQDQYGCSLGGINLVEFHPDDSVTYEAVSLSHNQRDALERNLVLFYLGSMRSASNLLRIQAQEVASSIQKTNTLKTMVEQARTLRADLCGDVDVLGPYLHEAWQSKRSLSPHITSPLIEEAYELGLLSGATGGKLLGAGGAGFLLFYVPGNNQTKVRAALSRFQSSMVEIDAAGSTIIYAD